MFVRREEVLFNQLAALSKSESGTVESERGVQRYQLSSSHSECEREGLRHQQHPRDSLETRSMDVFSLTWLPPAERAAQFNQGRMR